MDEPVISPPVEPEQLIELSRARAESIMAALGEDPGTMAAVSGSPQQVRASLADSSLAAQIVVANHNAGKTLRSDAGHS